MVGYDFNPNLDESEEDFNFDYAKYNTSILAGMLAAVTEPLYRKHTSKKFENDLNDPAKHTSKYYPEELLHYAVMRKFKEYYKYPNPDPKSYLHQYDSTFQDVYNLFADYDPENTSNFNTIYANAFNHLKNNFYANIEK
ncbi:hypothetical protein K5I29_01505 [Flavobacterium agricola]|uniref:Uncharacterized protein n=1 Tax=Flavobacterium agricola TaxID=2870839 RepID=A0ABY6M3N4_9FLAO|nr:hypothetical protein [Flavobacterium agricola]UYW01628.1 hypothetical protein K5I29_01505 [Flavobacterium agricola]